MKVLEKLKEIRRLSPSRDTVGLSDEALEDFLLRDKDLARAIDAAYAVRAELAQEFPAELKLSEVELCGRLQERVLNFYPTDCISPFVPLAARGPWIVTCHGAVLYETGGYGMLGLGHCPPGLEDPLRREYPMANVMTPSFSQHRLTSLLSSLIGGSRPCPYERFVFMNSGSEAVSVALRIADLNARRNTDPDGRRPGGRVRAVAVQGGFHGRTWRPARVSHSTRNSYQALASFRDSAYLTAVPLNDAEALEAAFEGAAAAGDFIEAVLLEPVMGEGKPGAAVTPEFYSLARKLAAESGALLIVDSIQAALRAHGVLSIMDYPGFENCSPPDCETYSKALNAGQYPLSVLALSPAAAQLYRSGVYGNTMTANPRALDVGCAVLELMTTEVRENVRSRGIEFLDRLKDLQGEFPELISGTNGTGLILALELNERCPVVGADGVERRLRLAGVNVIHGGANALRFTPWFKIGSEEITLIVDTLRTLLAQLGAEVGSSDSSADKAACSFL